jgi:hypothetical protein
LPQIVIGASGLPVHAGKGADLRQANVRIALKLRAFLLGKFLLGHRQSSAQLPANVAVAIQEDAGKKKNIQ